jgi:hypothetical protein
MYCQPSEGSDLMIGQTERVITISEDVKQSITFIAMKCAYIRTTLHDLSSRQAIEGALVTFIMVEDEEGNLCANVIGSRSTNADGCVKWLPAPAGCLVRAELSAWPEQYLSLECLDIEHRSDRVVRMHHCHTLEWLLPRKPQVRVSLLAMCDRAQTLIASFVGTDCLLQQQHQQGYEALRRLQVQMHDAASGERVHGVRYKVMSSPQAAKPRPPRVSFGGSDYPLDQVWLLQPRRPYVVGRLARGLSWCTDADLSQS